MNTDKLCCSSGLAFRLARRRLACRLRHTNFARLRSSRLLIVQPLHKCRQVLLNRSHLGLGLLPPLCKSRNLLTGGGEFGLDLSQIPDRRLLLFPLGPKLILGRL